MEEEEIEEISDSEPEPEVNNKRVLLKKSNSAVNIKEQGSKERARAMDVLTRSNSLNDLEGNCAEGKLEYLKDDFKQMHLVYKQLKSAREENQRRLKLMDLRKSQNHNYDTDIQQGMEEQSQLEICSIVLETQCNSGQQSSKGEQSQKTKKVNYSAKKPVTRAAKKQHTPKKR